MIEFDIYREEDRWFFDDPSKNIVHEEFVDGVPNVLLFLCGNREAKKVHVSVTTRKPVFVDSDELKFEYEDIDGVTYSCNGLKCWFCAVFFEYFSKKHIPESLWVVVKEIK